MKNFGKYSFNYGNSDLLYYLIIIFSGLFVYVNALEIKFFGDEIAFLERTKVADLNRLFALLGKQDFDADYYRPVPNFFSGFVSFLLSDSLKLHRGFAIILHIANSLLIYLIAVTFFHERIKALLSALIFLFFPINDLAVFWLTDTFDRFLFLFYFAGLLQILKSGGRFTLVSGIFFILAFLSKETALSFPVLVFLTNAVLLKKPLKESLFQMLPFLLILCAIIAFRYFAFDNNIFAVNDSHSSAGYGVILKNLMIFAGLLLLPFFNYQLTDFFSTNILTTSVILAAITVSMLISFARKADFVSLKSAFFLVLGCIFILLPVSRLVMKWYIYLPSGLYSILLILIIGALTKDRAGKKLFFITGGTILLLSLFSISITIFDWIKLTDKAEKNVKYFAQNNSSFIENSDTLNFITIPAKVANYPVNHLDFGAYFNYYLPTNKVINVFSRSSIKNMNDKIECRYGGDFFEVIHSGANFFILFGYEKYINFEPSDLVEGKLKRFRLNHNRTDRSTFIGFTEGKYILY